MKLETKRLILRDWRKEDIKDLVDGLNNLGVARWLAFVPHPYTRKHAEAWISHCMDTAKTRARRRTYEFAIELKSERKVIGGVSLDRINDTHGTAGGGIWINAQYQSKGYGSEAFGEKIRFAFQELKLRRLENGFFKANPFSLRMQKKFGYKVEGVKRSAFRCMADGKLKDEWITGLLKKEWKKATRMGGRINAAVAPPEYRRLESMIDGRADAHTGGNIRGDSDRRSIVKLHVGEHRAAHHQVHQIHRIGPARQGSNPRVDRRPSQV